MSVPRFFRALFALVPLLAFTACDRQAGTSDEHETTVAARLFKADGTPASGARVRLYQVDDTTKSPRAQVFATSDGSVILPSLPAGEYNLVATDGVGNGIVIDSLLSTGAGAPQLRNDTLRPMGVITGTLEVEPQHSPRIAWVQILGVGLAANVDTAGRFRLEVPAGRLTLAALTLEPQYTPTFRTLRTRPDSVVDVGTVRLEYTGIPVVQGLTVTYDTLNGVATLRWNRATAPGLRGYELQGVGWGSIAFDALTDTVYRDTLFRPEIYEDQPKEREYSVVAVDSARVPGLAWRWVAFSAPSPWVVPRRGFRIDTTLGIELPQNACSVIDTAAGYLVCIRESTNPIGMETLRFADSAEVRVSRDGKNWTLLPIPLGSLRTVVWKDRIWVVRGIENGLTRTLSVPWSQYPGSPPLDVIPLYDGARVESWNLDGTLERVDTVLDRKAAAMYRLMVVSDTLLLSRDTVEYFMATPGGQMAFSQGIRRIVAPNSLWSNELLVGSMFASWDWDCLGPVYSNEPYELKRLMAEENWNGWTWSRNYDGELFVARPDDRFPWKVGQAVYNIRYRGNGWVVPPIVVWKGCVLMQDPEASKIYGVCPEP